MIDSFSSAMRASVKIRGWVPVLMAAFSAGQPEGVEPERGEHGVAQHGAVADQQVTEGVVADVAHVGRAGRVGVHGEHVPGRAGVVGVHLVGALVGPAPLPLLLDFDDVVGPCHGSRSYRGRGRTPVPGADRPSGQMRPAIPDRALPTLAMAPWTAEKIRCRSVVLDAGGTVIETGSP